MEKFTKILETIDGYVWGIPLIVLIMAVGIFLTFRLRLLQIFHLPKALKFMFQNENGGKGEISSFAALCTALSATIGTGNIVGVATAIGVLSGGPGALLWMWIAALLGMATKFSEGFLAIKYRRMDADGHVCGGPFYYIEYGMGKKWKWLAKVFAFFGACVGLFGIGTFSQVNGISSAVQAFFDPKKEHTVNIFGADYTWAVIISGLLITIFAALVIIGGIKRISSVSQVVVPFMAVVYIVACLSLIVINIQKLPHAVALIFEQAFSFKAVAGGSLPTMFIAIQKGVARGIFSNESGLGSAPIAAAAAQTKEPVRQGLVSMCGTFIDTIIVCTMTGLAIVMMGSYEAINPVTGKPFEGVEVTNHAFQNGFSFLPFDRVLPLRHTLPVRLDTPTARAACVKFMPASRCSTYRRRRAAHISPRVAYSTPSNTHLSTWPSHQSARRCDDHWNPPFAIFFGGRDRWRQVCDGSRMHRPCG